MRFEQLLAAVQHADAGRAEHLVAGEAVEVAIELPARRRRACGTACAPSSSTGTPCCLARRDELLDRHDRAERVGDVREREQLRARTDQLLERGEIDFAASRRSESL